ncbi:gluconokinase [Leifsonia sp. A12D58]|uniref:gluconokinase n=1 Tax=Leifsonia sp. A12D58 TaxID=3397674 RepID=UPI0039DFA380
MAVDTLKKSHPLVVVMGVSGSGKTTIGTLIAEALHVPFADADGLHPRSNVVKMAEATPLTDEDRWPWLALVGEQIAAASETGIVMACSALKRSYRDAIDAAAPGVLFVHLHADQTVLSARIEGRSGHFMPPALLKSQFEALELLQADENGCVVNVAGGVDEIVRTAVDLVEQSTVRVR